MDVIRGSLASAVQSPAAWTSLAAAAATALIARKAMSYTMLNAPAHRPPGPATGQFSTLKDYVFKGEMHKFFDLLLGQYGDYASWKILDCWVFALGDAELGKHVLADNETFVREEGFEVACNSIGPLLFAISGPMWKFHRKTISPAFAPVHLRNSLAVIQDFAEKLFEQLDAEIDKTAADSDWSAPVNIHAMLSCITLDIFGRAFFSYNFDALQAPGRGVTRAADSLAAGITRRSAMPKWMWPFLVRDNFQESVGMVRKIIDDAIDLKLAALADAESTDLADRQKRDMDLLDNLILATQKDTDAMSPHELTSEMMGLFIAGHETTANSLTYATQALCDHPDLADELRQELDDVVGENELTIENIAQLKKLDCFIKEVLRYYSVVAVIPRKTSKPTQLGGYPVPVNSVISIVTRRLHHNPKYWRNPEQFNPSRFETDRIVPGSFMPFGDGPHKCVGERLAMLEIKVLLAKLLRRYAFKLGPNNSFKLVFSITLGYKEGLFVQFQPRKV
ncbi:hypothetical protein RI367_002503 [Sorochytrium milnesiophthora]